MQRVAVVGCGGAGKTHLSRQLARGVGLPLTHLDAVHYGPGWSAMAPAEFAARQHELVSRPRWVVDGNYAGTMPIRLAAADTVVFLDLPTATCLLGIAERRWRRAGRPPAEPGLHDRVTWEFVRYVASYRRVMRPRVEAMLAEHAGAARVVRLGSRGAADRFVADAVAGRLPGLAGQPTSPSAGREP